MDKLVVILPEGIGHITPETLAIFKANIEDSLNIPVQIIEPFVPITAMEIKSFCIREIIDTPDLPPKGPIKPYYRKGRY